jgi:hypothetical protein
MFDLSKLAPVRLDLENTKTLVTFVEIFKGEKT